MCGSSFGSSLVVDSLGVGSLGRILPILLVNFSVDSLSRWSVV